MKSGLRRWPGLERRENAAGREVRGIGGAGDDYVNAIGELVDGGAYRDAGGEIGPRAAEIGGVKKLLIRCRGRADHGDKDILRACEVRLKRSDGSGSHWGQGSGGGRTRDINQAGGIDGDVHKAFDTSAAKVGGVA